MKDNTKANVVFYCFGIIPVVWIALLIASYIDGGLIEIVKEFANVMNKPVRITFCDNSIKVILFALIIYALGIGMYESTKKNYRRKEEHGSTKWGNTRT